MDKTFYVIFAFIFQKILKFLVLHKNLLGLFKFIGGSNENIVILDFFYQNIVLNTLKINLTCDSLLQLHLNRDFRTRGSSMFLKKLRFFSKIWRQSVIILRVKDSRSEGFGGIQSDIFLKIRLVGSIYSVVLFMFFFVAL